MAILLQPRQTPTTCNPLPILASFGRQRWCCKPESKIAERASSVPSNAPPSCGNVTSEESIHQQKARTAQTCQAPSSPPPKGALK